MIIRKYTVLEYFMQETMSRISRGIQEHFLNT